MCSTCFPRPSLPIDASLSSTGSSGVSSPASSVLSKRYDFLPLIPPHFVAFVWRYLNVSLVVFAPRRTSEPPKPGVGHPVSPSGISLRKRQDLPGSWRPPIVRLHMLQSDSGRTADTRPFRGSSVAHGTKTAKAPTKGLSKLNNMAFGLAAYASQCASPRPTQHSLPVAGQALPDGLSTRKVPMKGFKVVQNISSPLPSFLAQFGRPTRAQIDATGSEEAIVAPSIGGLQSQLQFSGVGSARKTSFGVW